MSSSLETTIKTKLGIKYVDAKDLLAKALQSCEIEGHDVPESRFEEVVEEACEIFADLSESEQQEMRNSASEEPEWKKRAKAVCAKREAEFQAKQEAEAKTEAVRKALVSKGVPEDQVNGTTVKSIRKLSSPHSDVEEPKGKLTVRRHTCYCTIQ